MCPLSPPLSAGWYSFGTVSISERSAKTALSPPRLWLSPLKKAQYRNAIDLPADDARILHYLKGETIEIEPEEAREPQRLAAPLRLRLSTWAGASW